VGLLLSNFLKKGGFDTQRRDGEKRKGGRGKGKNRSRFAKEGQVLTQKTVPFYLKKPSAK